MTLRYAGSGPGEIGIELEGASFLDRWTSVGGKWIERVDVQEGVKYLRRGDSMPGRALSLRRLCSSLYANIIELN